MEGPNNRTVIISEAENKLRGWAICCHHIRPEIAPNQSFLRINVHWPHLVLANSLTVRISLFHCLALLEGQVIDSELWGSDQTNSGGMKPILKTIFIIYKYKYCPLSCYWASNTLTHIKMRKLALWWTSLIINGHWIHWSEKNKKIIYPKCQSLIFTDLQR